MSASACVLFYIYNLSIRYMATVHISSISSQELSGELCSSCTSESIRQFASSYLNLVEEMEHQMWIAVLVATTMVALPFNCLATDYTVGDSSQWDLSVNYTTWASGKTFALADKLVFKYTAGAHDVLVVNKAAYDSCLKTNSLASYTTGNDTVTLNATGAHYYICGIGSHCSLGQKLTITVGAASNGTAPAPSPSSTTPTTPPAQSPSTTPPAPSGGSPSPLSATTPPPAPTPASSTNGANPPSGSGSNSPSAAAPSYRMGGTGAFLLGISLMLAMASL